ncbi:hypothetical protein [Microbacterium sp. MMO-113]|uniref:hypothetical protein n=1 Tax=Microbacterium sp. MMO-113 TaxID=3081273 RepID=UPI003017EC77
MNARKIAVAIVAVSVLGLAGCSSPDTREVCEARGGEWTSTTILMPILVGKVTVLQPITTWSCEGGEQ